MKKKRVEFDVIASFAELVFQEHSALELVCFVDIFASSVVRFEQIIV